MDLLRLVLDARRISPTTATNALTIKDTPERIAAAARVLSAIDKARPEVIIDVELLEVDRTQAAGVRAADRVARDSPRAQRLGLDRRATPTGTITLQALRNLTQSDILLAEPAVALLPPAQDRHQHADAGQPAAAHLGRHRRRRRASASGPGAGDDLRADRHRRHAAAADHVVQLREHRRQHRHHAAHASRRRRVAER